MQKELLSAYIDGEQVSNELTEELCRDADLQESWAHFHTIRSVMRNETDVLLGADFSAKMEALIEQEEIRIAQPTVSQPTADEVEKSPFAQKLKAWFAPMMQVAVAAGVCLVAVTGFQSFTTANNAKEMPDTPVLQTLPFNNSVQEVSYNAPARDVVTPEQVEQKSKRIGAMLQNYELQRRVYADSLSMQRTEK
ncbi:sigma-E factor negative regulatory protein [Caviibacterium pharyngocola]|uniref:Anti-sigma-E factor RseA n=1 Tax=Caviibacterium pharyngocola TaxID=28159 RepID=A0A2M8RTG1_9PAST|nr:sigma-E factor negative regulatory protein [Caviibacterium pharyngocola]PJG82183.1 transcriptional regulator [Caviibacterium pharyngocola]